LTAAIGEGGAAITAELVPAVELTMTGSVVRACVVTVAATGSTVVLVVKVDALELAGVEPGDDTNAALGCTAVPTGALVATVVLLSSTVTGGSAVLVAATGASVTTAASAVGSAVVTVATVAEVPVGVVAAAVVVVSSEVAS
jgi:hypothetical protein